ncbi:MAG: translation initiation factor IF-2 [Candidatus Cloacimonetes bacterium]|jgi:translation initiation factor IF-2|nr:translation initiation factor IF-2 [Candidatus Cloacimonadota bacterium]
MPTKVHQLAKELKISTAALKKHLNDMGVIVKSHMSPIDEKTETDIRAKFNAEFAAVKKRQHDRNTFHKKIVLADRKKEEIAKEKKTQTPEKDKRQEVPTFVEKSIKKTDTRKPNKKENVYKKPNSSSKKAKLPDVPPTEEKRKFKDHDKKAVSEKAFDKKDKHLKAKMQHLSKGKRKKRFVPNEMQEAEIAKNIKQTLSDDSSKKKKYKKDKVQISSDTKLVINEYTSVSELAKLMGLAASEIITKFFMMGQMVTINQRLDKESLEMICDEFDFDVDFKEEYGSEILEEQKVEDENLELATRPPIVTIMGHVDHGKTAILDRIRSTNVIAGEAGGITQHIGAYQVDYNDHKITFLDTPGHEAFAAMRARGANVTDIAIIVVAANESVKKQTIEAIDHAKSASVTIIVAINKIDLKDANVDKTISDLMKHNIMLEDYGGDVMWTECSAKTGEGIDDLLESILLTTEMMELKAPVNINGEGIVIESKKDSRKGTIVTILMQRGKLVKSDSVVCGATYGHIRKIEDERGNEINELNPADVGVLYGLNKVPKAGDILNKVDDEKKARQISAERRNIRREREKFQTKTNLDNLFQRIKEDQMSEIKLIVKADTDGSVEALCDSFQKLSTEEIAVNIIRKAVGGINEADVNMASASDAIIIGFHVRAGTSAKKLAEDEKVEIKLYQIIYEAIEEIESAMTGMLKPKFVEKYLGTAVVKQAFRIKGIGTIAGVAVEKGVVRNEGVVRIYRNDIIIHEGKLSSLKHYSEEVKELKAGTEGGIGIENFNDIKTADIIENYIIEEVKRKLK